jgi:hypothetical protein
MVRDGRAGPGGRVVSGGVRGARGVRYLPIAEHGLIGDLHTVALVGHRRDDRLVLLPAV